jgi:hypothetical protein
LSAAFFVRALKAIRRALSWLFVVFFGSTILLTRLYRALVKTAAGGAALSFAFLLIKTCVNAPEWKSKKRAINCFEEHVNVDSMYGINREYRFYETENTTDTVGMTVVSRFSVHTYNQSDSVIVSHSDKACHVHIIKRKTTPDYDFEER